MLACDVMPFSTSRGKGAFGTALVALMNEPDRHISRRELTDLVGYVDLGTIDRYCEGAIPPLAMFFRIASVLDLNADEVKTLAEKYAEQSGKTIDPSLLEEHISGNARSIRTIDTAPSYDHCKSEGYGPFGKALVALMHSPDRHISRKGLTDLAGYVTQTTIDRYCDHGAAPGLAMFFRIASVLDLNADEVKTLAEKYAEQHGRTIGPSLIEEYRAKRQEPLHVDLPLPREIYSEGDTVRLIYDVPDGFIERAFPSEGLKKTESKMQIVYTISEISQRSILERIISESTDKESRELALKRLEELLAPSLRKG
jgi:hypothetical protein